MEKIKQCVDIFKTAFSTIIAIITGFYSQKYLFDNPDLNFAVLVVIAICVFIIMSSANICFNLFVNTPLWVRRNLLGKHFIEGYWLQAISSKSLPNRAPIHSLVYISFDRNQYTVSGYSYNAESKLIAKFSSQSSEYNKHKLKYPFSVTSEEIKDYNIFGFSELDFSSIEKYPTEYLGHVYSNIRDSTVMVYAKKISNEERNKMETIEGRKEVISAENLG